MNVLWFVENKRLLYWLILITISAMNIAHANRYASKENDNSLANAFDTAIASLSEDGNTFYCARDNAYRGSNTNDLDYLLQSMANDLDTKPPIKDYMGLSQFDHPQIHSLRGDAYENKSKRQKKVIAGIAEDDETFNSRDHIRDNNCSLGDYDFELALTRFKQSSDYGQVSLQQVIDLLDVERHLVHHLIAGHSGTYVKVALDERNRLVSRTIPDSIQIYETILALSTYDNQNNAILNRRIMGGRRLLKALNSYDQKIFLARIEDKLAYYQDFMRSLQNKVVKEVPLLNNVYCDQESVVAMNDFISELN